MNIKSKGFTIVELAIVLVVIGLILGMAVKGRALVEAARYRMEVTKIRNMEVYLYAYSSATDGDIRTLGLACNALIDTEPMIEGGILTQADMTSYFYGSKESDDTIRAKMTYIYRFTGTGVNRIGDVLCATTDYNYVFVSPVHDPAVFGMLGNRTKTEWKYACQMENLIDERIEYLDGSGVVIDPGKSGRVRIEGAYSYSDYKDCSISPEPSGVVLRPQIYVGEVF